MLSLLSFLARILCSLFAFCSFFVCLALPPSLPPLSLSCCLCLSGSLSHCLSLSLSVSLCLSLSLSVSLSLSDLSVSLCLSLSLSVSLCLPLCLSVSLCLPLSPSVSLCLSVPLSLCPSVSLSLCLSVSLSLFLSACAAGFSASPLLIVRTSGSARGPGRSSCPTTLFLVSKFLLQANMPWMLIPATVWTFNDFQTLLCMIFLDCRLRPPFLAAPLARSSDSSLLL